MSRQGCGEGSPSGSWKFEPESTSVIRRNDFASLFGSRLATAWKKAMPSWFGAQAPNPAMTLLPSVKTGVYRKTLMALGLCLSCPRRIINKLETVAENGLAKLVEVLVSKFGWYFSWIE